MNTDTSKMNDSQTSDIVLVLQKVQQDIRTHEVRHARSPGSVQLLAVSKRKPLSAIQAAIQAGQRAFGENYVEEGVEKILALDDATLQWHFIGAIQSRKTASIAEHFQWAHGVDRLKVARRLSEQRPAGMAPLNICLQVNTDNESAKAGVEFDEVDQLADECAELPGLTLRGLMAIPAPRSDFEEQRQVFARLHECLQSLQKRHPGMDTLSMGMSADMEAAIAEGATLVRIGTAIFGQRDN
ncbi:YggS family pyridoxal phosphate-dependent enzyme [Granulosicoccus sp. 3-233]|uniref:YggS family pyridoxal phosphate-dependent enzyme n=1 Tax=Granulosicoccus sp. 3-233 TaxID=3417969 RepID=UPI003D33A6D4